MRPDYYGVVVDDDGARPVRVSDVDIRMAESEDPTLNYETCVVDYSDNPERQASAMPLSMAQHVAKDLMAYGFKASIRKAEPVDTHDDFTLVYDDN